MGLIHTTLTAEELTLLYHGYLCRLTVHEITDAVNDCRLQRKVKAISASVINSRISEMKQLQLHRLHPDQLLEIAGQHLPSLCSVFATSRHRLDAVLPLAKNIKEHLGQELIDQAYERTESLEDLQEKARQAEVRDFV